MIVILLALAMLTAQGIPVLPNQGGTVTGILRTSSGTPAAGVRVSALARPEATKDLSTSAALASLAETDASGRYRLENIPPGRYYIVAGNIDVPTFYPGSLTANEGIVILISPGVVVPDIDFALNGVSASRAVSSGAQGRPTWIVPIQARIEGGDRLPIFAEGFFPILRFTRTGAAPIVTGLGSANVSVPDTEYRVNVENLPEGYSLKSLTFGSTDLRINPLKLDPNTSAVSNFAAILPVTQVLSVVLDHPLAPERKGVRVSGRIRGDPNRSIYISGSPGSVYTDGTFEFLGVLPGRHTVVTLDNPGRERSVGASIVVGNREVQGLELEETSIVPLAAGRPAQPGSSENVDSSARLPLATIRGRVVDGITGDAFDAGRVVVNGDHALTFSLEAEGRFEIPRLLPGSYMLEVTAYGVGTVTRTVLLDDKDENLDFSIE